MSHINLDRWGCPSCFDGTAAFITESAPFLTYLITTTEGQVQKLPANDVQIIENGPLVLRFTEVVQHKHANGGLSHTRSLLVRAYAPGTWILVEPS